MGMEKQNGDIARSSTVPTSQKKSEKNKENKKSKSLTDKIRSKFSRNKSSNAAKKQDDSDEITYGKIVVLGQAGVGKTAFIHRLVNNYFTEQYTPTTVSASFDVTAIVECEDTPRSRKDKILEYAVRKTKSFRTSALSKHQSKQESNTKTFKFQLVDTTEDINDASPMMYRSTVANAHGFLLLASSDHKESVKYISKIYEDIAEMRINTIVPVIIIQNKDDLHTGSIEDEQFESEIEQLAVSLEVETCQISTANSSGFETLTELLLNEMNVYNDEYEQEMAMPDDIVYSYTEAEPERKYLYIYIYLYIFILVG